MTPLPDKNYSHKGWLAIAALIAVLALVSFIPAQTIGSISLRRANIFSDLYTFDDASGEKLAEKSAVFDEEEFHIDMAAVAEQIEADTLQRQVQTTFEWNLPTKERPYVKTTPDSILLNPVLVPIEDFSPDGKIKAFTELLLDAQRPVRIAFMGDSFIEGDILTADLREKLQTAFGASPRGGTGFAPMASPLTAFRRTIKTQSKGWSSYNIMQRRAAPAHLRENFYVSGWACRPSVDASTRWENTSFRQLLDSCSTASVFFISAQNSRVVVTLNDTLKQEFLVHGHDAVRQIRVSAPHIHSLTFRVASGTEGFIGYGAVFGGQGVVLDNYSIRSNNGQAMFWTNPSVNAQINAMLGYDLVIMQYGLNIMQDGVRNYSNYADQIEKMVAFVRECFPGAAVLLLSVSDRAVKTDTGYASMDAIPYMVDCQRKAAQNAKAAFWPTSDAMRSLGGMQQFVARGWAGKDFTHINYAGGRKVAWSLFDAFNARACVAFAERQIAERRKEAVLDSEQLQQIDESLRLPFSSVDNYTEE